MNIYKITCIIIFFWSGEASATSGFDIAIEGGGVWQNRNDVQITPDDGTRFSIDELGEGPYLHYRMEGFYRFNKHHAVRALYAPFQLELTGRAPREVNFNGARFPNSADLTVFYKFNSYRLSYIYGFWGFGADQLNIGFTGKIRDAETQFRQNGIASSYDNIGFVPLIYFEYQKSMGKVWSLNFQMDASAAPQGRAIDAALKVRRKIADQGRLGFGVRTLEGGADNEKVFAFSWFNYVVIDGGWSF